MQKKFLVSLTATATAFSMLVAPSLTAFAEDAASNDNPVSYVLGKNGVEAGDYKVEEDVIRTDGGTAVTVSGEGINVSIDGNVDSSGVKEYKSGDTVTYKGATGVSVSQGADVIIEKDVTGGSRGVSVTNDSSLTVKGDVIATGTDQTQYNWNPETKKYDIPENTTTGTGIVTDGNSNVTINGSIGAVDYGISITPDKKNDGNNGSIVVGDSIVVSGDNGYGIQIVQVPEDRGGVNYKSVDDALDEIPELVIYEIDAETPVNVLMATADDPSKPNQEIEKAVISAINYIVKQNEESVDKYGMAVSGTDKNGKFDTVKIGQEFTVKVDEIPEGYELNGGDNVKVTKNEDGSFTLKLENEKGGIYVQVRLIPVSNPDGSTSYVVEPESNQDRTETPQSTAGAIVISNNQGAADAPSTVASISGTKPARTATYNLASITPLQYKESIVANVAAAPQGGAFNIQTDRVSCFDKTMIQAFASRPDIDVNVVFTYGGKKLKVTIPAGYDVNKLLDENGYCGFLRLMSILGSTEL